VAFVDVVVGSLGSITGSSSIGGELLSTTFTALSNMLVFPAWSDISYVTVYEPTIDESTLFTTIMLGVISPSTLSSAAAPSSTYILR